MNRNDIIKLAREVGIHVYPEFEASFERFFQAAYAVGVAAERERVAAEFDRRAVYSDGTPSSGWYEPHEPAEIVRSMK